VELQQCPYDGTEVAAETLSGGSLLLSCACCGARWELHGAWLRRVDPPDPVAVRAARSRRAEVARRP
jgi:hypothetical protein